MLRKSILLFTLLFFALNGQAQQQNPQAIFDQANYQLQQGNIAQALKLYKSLEDQNKFSGALFLNMALSYIRVDSMGKAKYYFLKAQEFEGTRERAGEGLIYVENQFSRQSAVLPTLPWQKALNWLEDEAGSTVLLAIGLLLLNAGIFLYISGWFTSRKYAYVPTAAIGIAVTGTLIVMLSFYVDYRDDRYHQAVMITREAAVREQPAADAALVSQAFEGYTFSVDQHKSSKQEEWTYIQMSNGQYGWILTDEIMIL